MKKIIALALVLCMGVALLPCFSVGAYSDDSEKTNLDFVKNCEKMRISHNLLNSFHDFSFFQLDLLPVRTIFF